MIAKNRPNRRNADRRHMNMPVTKQSGDDNFDCWISDISPTGVRIPRVNGDTGSLKICNLELHLVPGSISTVVAARQVWHDEDFEAFEFIDPSFAQQAILERMADNY